MTATATMPTPANPTPGGERWRATPAAMARHFLGGRWWWPDHVDWLSRRLAYAATTPHVRMIVTMPPRHGKSTVSSEWFPVWYLSTFPRRRIMLVGFESEFAASWGRRVRNHIEEHGAELGVTLAPDSSAANRWETGEGGGMLTAGVGGSITGRGADVLIVDDPISNAEDAESATIRNKLWEWWRTTAYTRLEPNGAAVVVQTRWHEDDLAGRLLADARAGGEAWEVANLPAIAEDGDALGRKEGEALWPARFSVDDLRRIERSVGPRAWASLYQQRPSPAGGGLFRRDYFRYAEDRGDHYLLRGGGDDATRPVFKADCWRFATVDTAWTTGTQSDYSVRQVWDVEPRTTEAGLVGRSMILVDQWRERVGSPQLEAQLRRDIERFRLLFVGMEVISDGATIFQRLQLDGLPMRRILYGETKRIPDKVTKAIVAEVWMAAGKVFFLRGAPYLDALESELLAFPNGAHDDTVDALAMAAHFASRRDLSKEKPPTLYPKGTLGYIAGHDKAFGKRPEPLADPFREGEAA